MAWLETYTLPFLHADVTHVMAPHPVITGPEGKNLFLRVTKLGERPGRWHVSVKDPPGRPITARLRKAMDLQGLALSERSVTLGPGGQRQQPWHRGERSVK